MTFDPARAMFNQADINHDGTIDHNEFKNWVSGANVTGGASTYDAGYLNNTIYENSLVGSGYNYSDLSGYETSGLYANGGYGYGAGVVGLGGAVYDNSLLAAQTAVQAYPTDAQGLYLDSNPTVIRRPNAQGVATYTQNVAVRFLQPPPVPPHGPLIIKEVRPPQPPPPPPLRIRQQAPPLPQPPPLVLREHPPPPPRVIPSQTVIRRLPGLPVPPRSVIIERLPPLPPRPRDVIMERWLPYGPQAKRRTIVQRAPPAVPYARPRNVIIQYEPVQARVVRQFQRLGVTPANPSAYVQTYGASLLDAGSLLHRARAAGVVEDISPPAYGYNAATYGQNIVVGGAGYIGDAGLTGAGYIGDAGWTGAGYIGDAGWTGAGYIGDAGYVGNAGWAGEFGASASYYDQGWNGGVVGGVYAADAADVAFDNADVNRDGRIDRDEFNRFVAQGL